MVGFSRLHLQLLSRLSEPFPAASRRCHPFVVAFTPFSQPYPRFIPAKCPSSIQLTSVPSPTYRPSS
ncbi:unnamed protein product [Linum tenue]|uniref:Uncharacterized protein n=1 Tax=Linum tenue TaxID=586396 RepID=A0AAV0HRF1_9ROSI|nr:unnamed protein product [Linum tenue]